LISETGIVFDTDAATEPAVRTVAVFPDDSHPPVVYPAAGNLGGGGFMTIQLADGRKEFLDFREKAPLAATATMYLDGAGDVVKGLSTRGHLAVGVPGSVAGLEVARTKYGTRSRWELIAPAIRFADKGFVLEQEQNGVTDKGYYYASNKFSAPEHGGTHIDAPRHFSVNGNTLDQVPLEQLMGKAVLIDVTRQCESNRDYLISVNDFNAWEKQYGQIPDGSIVLLRTGFAKYWPDRVKNMGTDERGTEAVAKLHFPGLSPDAARWLTTSRSIKAIGLDTPSIDYGQSTLYESHQILFARNVPAFENLGDLSALPASGFTVIAMPMKIAGGSGGPLRIAAIVE